MQVLQRGLFLCVSCVEKMDWVLFLHSTLFVCVCVCVCGEDGEDGDLGAGDGDEVGGA